MMPRRKVSLSFAAFCITAVATLPAHAQPVGTYGSAAGYSAPEGSVPQSNQGDVAQSVSARRNVVESRQYDRAVETNRGFRQARMRKECGPITDPELHQSCLASFNQDEPQMGLSNSGRRHRSGSSQ